MLYFFPEVFPNKIIDIFLVQGLIELELLLIGSEKNYRFYHNDVSISQLD